MREIALQRGLGKATAWNKGLTKFTDERVRKYGQKESQTKQQLKLQKIGDI